MVEVFGQQYQHGTSKFTFVANGVTSVVIPLKTVKKVSPSFEAMKQATNDAQGQVDGFTVMASKHDANITLKESEWFAIRAALSTFPGGVLLAQFQFIQTYGNGGNAPHRLELNGCMIQKEAYNSEDSQEAHVVELPLFFLKMLVDGKPPLVYDP